jgi:hypothetical protein
MVLLNHLINYICDPKSILTLYLDSPRINTYYQKSLVCQGLKIPYNDKKKVKNR